MEPMIVHSIVGSVFLSINFLPLRFFYRREEKGSDEK